MAQYDQLMLLYSQLDNMADEIKRLIDKELYDYVQDKMIQHEKIVLQISLIYKCTKFSDDELKKINEIKKKISEKEKNNIDLMQENMSKVKIELNRINLKNKIQKAYDQAYSENSPTIMDVDDSYQGEA